ncbi:MAG: T9SS type A sorting domain-containing protein, partial [Chitinophagaceae bacterium]|nr:T9SS type A sorting domain-containing protein [Chitinophagaceae bacterium]
GLVTQYQIGALTGIKINEKTDLQRPFLYPNPTTEYLYWSRNETLKQVRLVDFSGRMIAALQVVHNAIILPYDLPKGTYLITVLTEQNKLNSQLIYKQ